MPPPPSLKERLALALVPRLAAGLIRALRLTLRVRFAGREVVEGLVGSGTPYIHAFWHGRLLIMPYSYLGRRITILISRHRDGEYIARTMRNFGFHSTRGSSSAGGTAALRQAVRWLNAGGDVAFTPDGPRGPARVCQPGVVQAARLSGAPIVPVTLAAARGRRLASWDSFLVPRPFSRALIAYGRPVTVPRDADERELEDKRLELERALNELTDWADARIASPRGVAEPSPHV